MPEESLREELVQEELVLEDRLKCVTHPDRSGGGVDPRRRGGLTHLPAIAAGENRTRCHVGRAPASYQRAARCQRPLRHPRWESPPEFRPDQL